MIEMKDLPNVKVFAKTCEKEALVQIEDMMRSEAYKDCMVRIMPDCHAGKGCTIGTVISIKDKVVPNTVGVDIGCGMLTIGLKDFKDEDLAKLDEVINKYVPSGFNIHDTPQVGENIQNMLENLRCISAIDINNAMRSVGSLGGGNHFIEVAKSSSQSAFLIIHSGSRNLGVRVAKYYQDKAIKHCERSPKIRELIEELKAQGRQREIEVIVSNFKNTNPGVSKDLAYLEGKDLEDYLEDMKICQLYAVFNRRKIAQIIMSHLGWEADMEFETIHNYISFEDHTLRKGAVAAHYGQTLLIPMNMRDGSLLCKGKGNDDWLYSAPHGAGRLMSRAKAKETLKMDDFTEAMTGIYTTSVCKETLDEAPMAYKPAQEIIEAIKPTVMILDVLKPVYNFKAKGS